MSRGLTLIEVLLVVALLSVLVGAGVMGFLSQREAFEMSGEVNELFADLRYAKQLSITEQIHHGVEFDFENNSYRVFRDNEERETVKEKFLSLEMESVNNYSEVKFTRFGAVFRSGKIRLKSDNILRIIEIKPSGFFHEQRDDTN